MSRPRIPPPPKRELRRLYEREGLGSPQIAKRYGVAQSTMYDWLVAAGVKVRPWGSTPESRFLDAHFYRLWRSGVTMPEIARRYGVTKQRVHQRIARHRRSLGTASPGRQPSSGQRD